MVAEGWDAEGSVIALSPLSKREEWLSVLDGNGGEGTQKRKEEFGINAGLCKLCTGMTNPITAKLVLYAVRLGGQGRLNPEPGVIGLGLRNPMWCEQVTLPG